LYTDRQYHIKPKDDKPRLKGRGQGHVTSFSISAPAVIFTVRLKRQSPNFVYR